MEVATIEIEDMVEIKGSVFTKRIFRSNNIENKMREIESAEMGDLETINNEFDKLENLLKKETKKVWDKVYLEKYIDIKRIPRGLRFDKKSSFELADVEYNVQWEEAMDACSFTLMKLIIKHHTKTLIEIDREVTLIQKRLETSIDNPTFISRDRKLADEIDAIEKNLIESKNKKFRRDEEDYVVGSNPKWQRVSLVPPSTPRDRKMFKYRSREDSNKNQNSRSNTLSYPTNPERHKNYPKYENNKNVSFNKEARQIPPRRQEAGVLETPRENKETKTHTIEDTGSHKRDEAKKNDRNREEHWQDNKYYSKAKEYHERYHTAKPTTYNYRTRSPLERDSRYEKERSRDRDHRSPYKHYGSNREYRERRYEREESQRRHYRSPHKQYRDQSPRRERKSPYREQRQTYRERHDKEQGHVREQRSPRPHTGHFLEQAQVAKPPPIATQNRTLVVEEQKEIETPNTKLRKRPHEESGEEEGHRKRAAM
ncbi:uncharacterized protein LOC142476725 [Ascaphus truei]|uniref:uncharacterized protein LOC142476725 n=1 Tax=Ascaphus truei TaxID=8439 RepID=UPI003F5925CA